MTRPHFTANTLALRLLTIGLLTAVPLTALSLQHDDHGHEHEDHDHDHDDSRQLGAHVHGAAQLLLARDGDHVTVLLETPSINVVGFEHYAQTDADREALINAEALLGESANVFVLSSAAQCALESSHIRSEQLAEMHDHADDQDHEHSHEEHGHDDHGHDDHGHSDDDHGHNDHGHDEHGHSDDDHGHNAHGHDDHGHDDHSHDDGSVHSEFNVTYEFHCEAPDNLRGAEVTAFNTFPGFETIDVQWVLDGQQGAQRTQPGRADVRF